MSVENYTDYPREPDGKTLERELRRQMVEKPLEDLCPGDWVTMWFDRRTKFPQHVAMISDKPNQIIHTFQTAKKVMEHELRPRWKDRFISAFSYRELSDA